MLLRNLTPNLFHFGSRSRRNVPDTAFQPLSRCNLTKTLLPKCPPPQAVAPALAPQPLVTIGRRARGAVFAIVIDLAELVDALAGEEHPSCGRWHVHRCAPVLLRRLARDFDALHKADLGVKRHANWLPTKSEMYCAKGGGI